MPTLDILNEDDSLKQNAAEIIFAVMHFPSKEQKVERRRYQSFLETTGILKNYERRCRLMGEPDLAELDENDLACYSRPNPDFTYEEIQKIKEGRNFSELMEKPERFYRRAYAAANNLMFAVYSEVNFPEFNSFERWKYFYETCEAVRLSRDTGLDWPKSHGSLQGIISQFRSTQHLWAACLYGGQFVRIIDSAGNVSGPAASISSKAEKIKNYSARRGFNFGPVNRIEKLLSYALFFQQHANHQRADNLEAPRPDLWVIPPLSDPKIQIPSVETILSTFREPKREELEGYVARAYR